MDEADIFIERAGKIADRSAGNSTQSAKVRREAYVLVRDFEGYLQRRGLKRG